MGYAPVSKVLSTRVGNSGRLIGPGRADTGPRV